MAKKKKKFEVLTIEGLTLKLCAAILAEEFEDEITGQAAFLQAVIEKDFGSMQDFRPVYHRGRYIGVREADFEEEKEQLRRDKKNGLYGGEEDIAN